MSDTTNSSVRLRAVITGGAGFLGSHLCRRLLAEGYAVVCVDNFSTGSKSNIEELLGREDFELVEADVSEGLAVPGRVDAVLHFASPASPVDYLRMPIETLKVGSFGTHHALELARANASRFLLASTSEVYGDPLEHPQRETYWGNVNPIGVRAVYDEAKRFAEAITMAYHRRHGLDTRIARIHNTYGPLMRPEDGRVVSNFIIQALRGEPLTVHGGGDQTRSFQYVDDLVEGIWRLLNATGLPEQQGAGGQDEGGAGGRRAGRTRRAGGPRADERDGAEALDAGDMQSGGWPGVHEPVNIGNPDEFTVLELAAKVVELTDSRSPLTYVSPMEDDPQRRRPDISRARNLLGWQPVVPLAEGLTRTIPYFRRVLGLSA